MSLSSESNAVDARPLPASSGEGRRLAVDRFFEALVRFSGSDLHLKVGRPPLVRVRGSL